MLLDGGGVVPDDPQFGYPVGDPIRYHHDLIDTPGAWAWFQESREPPEWGGAGVQVAVLDVAYPDFEHEDLLAQVIIKDDPIEDSRTHVHPTFVIGLLAGVTNNATGIAGVASDVGLGDSNIWSYTIPWTDWTTEDLCGDIVRAADDGAQIISRSILLPEGFDPGNPGSAATLAAYREAFDHAYLQDALVANCAGNRGWPNPDHLNFEQLLMVAATTETDEMWYDFDDNGTHYGTGIDICAPGKDVYSASYDGDNPDTHDLYEFGTGTSYSTPIVSGVAALIWSKNPGWTRDQVAAQLLGTTDDIYEINAGWAAEPSFPVDGDLWGMLGTGRVNANRAVNETLAPPQIEGIRQVPNEITAGMTELIVDLPNVFQTSTWGDAVYDPELDRDIYTVDTLGPVDDPDNWQLIYAGPDNIFGEDDPNPLYSVDDEVIDLVLDFAKPGDYSDIPGYKIATNDLRFTFDMPDPQWNNSLQKNGAYRLRAIADDPGDPEDNGLRDPFLLEAKPLDGNGDGVGGDDFVQGFWIGEPNLWAETDADACAAGLADDGYDDYFDLIRSTDRHGYLDVVFHSDAPGYGDPVVIESVLMMQLEELVVHGSSDSDTVMVEYFGEELGLEADPFCTIMIDGGGGDDELTAYGSPGDDYLFGYVGDSTLFVTTRYFSDWQDPEYIVTTVTEEGMTAIDHLTIHGGGGHDAGELSDGPTNDTFENYLDEAVMDDGGRLYDRDAVSFDFVVHEFEEVSASAENGGNDLANLHGTDGDDVFRGYHIGSVGYEHASLTTDQLVLRASGFDEVVAETTDGVGTAHFYGTDGTVEDFSAVHVAEGTDWASMSGTGWSNRALAFDTVYVHALEDTDTRSIPPQLDFRLFVLFHDPANPLVETFFWDEKGDAHWNDRYPESPYTHWLDLHGEPMRFFPELADDYAVIESNTPETYARAWLPGLWVSGGGGAFFQAGFYPDPEQTPPPPPADLVLADGTLNVGQPAYPGPERRLEVTDLAVSEGGGTITVSGSEENVVAVVGALSAVDTLNVNARVELEDGAEYGCQVTSSGNGLVAATGEVELIGNNTLTLEALEELEPELDRASQWCNRTRTIITSADPAGVSGTFGDEPGVGDHLGFGIFPTDLGANGACVTYVGVPPIVTALEVDLLQALGGDTDGDRDVDFGDFNNVANNYTGALPPGVGGKDWSQGDFDGDADVDFADFNTLANNYTGADILYTEGEVPEGGGGAAAGAGGGGGERALLSDMLARGYAPPRWLRDFCLVRLYELQPSWVYEYDDLGESLLSDESASATVVDRLLELLMMDDLV